MIDNPFYNRLLIKDPNEFFGRKDELNDIFSLIDKPQPQSVSIVGERRLGKSSLLYQVYSRYKKTMRNPDDYLFCYLDLQGESSCESFYEGVMRLAGLSYPKPIDYFAFKEGLERIRKVNNKKLVLLLDEFDVLIKDERFDSGFLEGLRSLAPKYDISYITASQRPLKDICHQEAKGSPFFNIFHLIDLSVFKIEEAEEMLLTLSERGGRRFSDKIIEDILAYVGYHPFFIQFLAYYVFDELGRGGGSFESAVERFRPEAKAHLEYYLKHLTDRERTVIADLSKNNDKIKEHLRINKEEINRLINSGWLIEKEGEYQLVPVFTEGVIQQKFYPINPVNPVKNYPKEDVKMAKKEELEVHKNNLGILNLQKAKFGTLYVPLHILSQIEDEENEIKRLEQEIEDNDNQRVIAQPQDRGNEKQTMEGNTKLQQNTSIANCQNITIIQTGRDYNNQKPADKLPSTQPLTPSEPKKPPISALVLLSNPFVECSSDTLLPIPQLEIDKEKEILDEKLRQVSAGIFVDFVPATTCILQEKLMTNEYKILHFIGHGMDEGGGQLCLEDNCGILHILDPEGLKSLLYGKDIWLLLLNACHSEEIAEKLKDIGIRAIISIEREETILDKAAITFSGRFYAAIGSGLTVAQAFEEGKKGVRLDPELKKDAKDEAEKYKLIPKDGGNFKLIDTGSTAPYTSSMIENKTINLPSLPPTFVGREEDIVGVNKALLSSKPVITLKGIPGVGKTTLAVKVAYWHKVHSHFNVGIIFVDCTKHPSHHQLIEEIGRGIFDSIDEKIREEMVLERLNRERYLLILDNFEDVQEKELTRHFLREIKRASRIIITSRQQVGLSGFEEIIEVGLLPIKKGMCLFVAHAKAIGYRIEQADLPVISEIVTLLEGLPSSVELSARLLGVDCDLKALLADIKEKDGRNSGQLDRAVEYYMQSIN
ncbi:MAG: NB-ARC domain-containing protein [bacterium]